MGWRGVMSGVAGLSLLVGACGDREDAPPAMPKVGPVPAELAEGERLFTASCARCHGTLALGTKQGPPLVHRYYVPSHHADIAFQRAVAYGVVAHHWKFGAMPKIEGLDQTAVARVTAYVRWLQREAGLF